MEGVMFVVANWPSKGQEQIIADFKETDEPWMTRNSLCTCGDVWMMKEPLQKAGKADRRQVRGHLPEQCHGRTREIFPGGRVKFVEHGRRDGACS